MKCAVSVLPSRGQRADPSPLQRPDPWTSLTQRMGFARGAYKIKGKLVGRYDHFHCRVCNGKQMTFQILFTRTLELVRVYFHMVGAKRAGVLLDPQTGASVGRYRRRLQSWHEVADRGCLGEEPQSPPECSRPAQTWCPEPPQRGSATLSESGLCPLWAEEAAE